MAEETKELSTEEREKILATFTPEVRKGVADLNKEIAEHNRKVNQIRSAESSDPKLIKQEIFEQRHSENRKLKALYDAYEGYRAKIEEIIKQAYEIIEKDGLMPKELTEEEVTKLKDEIHKSAKELRTKISVFKQFELLFPQYKGKIELVIDPITSLRGKGRSSSSDPNAPKQRRIRFKMITVNGITEDDKGNTVWGKNANGEIKYTFTSLAAYLNKQHRSFNMSVRKLQEEYLKDIKDPENLPEEHTFTIPYTYKDQNGNSHTLTYEIKCYRSGAEDDE